MDKSRQLMRQRGMVFLRYVSVKQLLKLIKNQLKWIFFFSYQFDSTFNSPVLLSRASKYLYIYSYWFEFIAIPNRYNTKKEL